MKQRNFTNEALSSLCKALSHFIHAGISVPDTLYLLAEDEENADLQQLLSGMAQSTDQGISLVQAFRQAKEFPSYLTALLEVGNRVGRTEETLTALANYYEGRAQMTARLRSTLLYPAALLGVLLVVMVVLLVWVMPIFQEVYAQLGGQLTGLAGGLSAFGGMLRGALPVLCGLLVLAGIALGIPSLRRRLIRLGNGLFGDKGAFANVNTARFLQALSMGLSSGMTDQEAAFLAASLAESQAPGFRRRCTACLGALSGGKSLAKALRESEFLTAGDCRLLEAGNRSGRSVEVMADIARRTTLQSEENLERAAGKVEPVLVLVACLLIGVVLLSVMLPLMNIMSTIG